jgi:hypothetical protein
MATVDLKQHVEGALRSNYDRLVKDLKAIPAEKQGECPGGCTRSALNLVAECAMLNGFIAGYLTGANTPRPSAEERTAFLASFDSEEKTLAYLEQETNKLIETVRGLEETTLGDEMPFFNRTLTKFAVAEFPAIHMSYHDGQLNYLQTLHGDAEVHW